MMIRAWVVVLSLAAGAASAQQPDVDFRIIEDGQAAGCAGSIVSGLDPAGDDFLAVRTGPGTDYRKIDELQNGDLVRACAGSGPSCITANPAARAGCMADGWWTGLAERTLR